MATLDNLFRLRQFQLHNGYETTYGTAEGSPSWVDVQVVAGPTVNWQQTSLDDNTTHPRMGAELAPLLGLKSSQAQFSCYLRGTGSPAGNGQVAQGVSTRVEHRLLAATFGGISTGTGTTENGSASTTTSVVGTDTSGITAGEAIFVNGEFGYVQANAANTMTLMSALSAAPTNGNVIYGCATFYVTQEINNYLQAYFHQEGLESVQLLGLGGTVNFSDLTTNNRPKCAFDLMGASWTVVSGTSLSTLSLDNTTLPPVPGDSSIVQLQAYNTTTRNAIHATAVSINPGFQSQKLDSVAGIQGAQRVVRTNVAPIIELTVRYSDTYRHWYESAQPLYFTYQIGTVAGKAVAFEAPRCYLVEKPERVETNGLSDCKLKLKASEDSSESTEILRSPLRLHIT